MEAIETDTFTAVFENGDTYDYRVLDDGSAQITRCNSLSSRLFIPEELDGLNVVSLDDASFLHLRNVEYVVCPKTLRAIGCRAFEGCHRLQSVVFNEGLQSIGDEAFKLCPTLSSIILPCSLERLGVNVTGAQGNQWTSNVAPVHIDPNSPYLFVEDGVVYERTEDGLVIIDGSRCTNSHLIVNQNTHAIGARAFAQNSNIRSVVLPEGLVRIGKAAFRGCINLASVELPETLHEVGDSAFSCTRLEELRIPANCTNAGDTSFIIGPIIAGAQMSPYRSSLKHITVQEGNSRFTTIGSVLCRNDGQGGRVALMCTNTAEYVDLSGIATLAPSTFLGTASIGTLTIDDNVAYDKTVGLFPQGSCQTFVVARSEIEGGALSLEMPERHLCERFFAQAFTTGTVDIEQMLSVYDEIVMEQKDLLARSRQVLARLSNPLFLGDQARNAFEGFVSEQFENICVNFGARSFWTGFEQLVDAGFITSANICDVIALLTRFGDTPGAGFLLQLKNRRFGKATWDYDL